MIQQHGGNAYSLKNILDFSANINPLGMPESVKEAIAASISEIEKYPDPDCTELRKKISVHEDISVDRIICGNGADDLIFRIVHALKPRKAFVCAPTFTEYTRALYEVGCKITEYHLSEQNCFDVTADILTFIDKCFDLCFICNPNNPTGRLITPEILGKLSKKCQESNVVLVCDECFLDFVTESEKHSLRNFMNGNSVILKAFTKLYAMPGIRLGYAVCGSTELAEKIRNSGQFWSVSSVAQKAGITALNENNYVHKTMEYIASERAFLSTELQGLGIKVYDSAANFLLFKSDKGLAEKLLAGGILIRDCSNFSGLSDGFCRIAVRTHSENKQLIEALRRCMNG
ncbi:MAG: threonine-phosphate decarboxylase [Ruminococcus flavefaciens]|jgi:threonine-phosphate decarboxylase|nr:threonine-phosphate decarboxylase [Ruminococcus flavefaciens]